MEKKPRPHAELIIAWANGAEIQYRKDDGMEWTDAPDPAFVADYQYRVKPAREYPKLDVCAVKRIADYFCLQEGTVELVAGKVLYHAIDYGQVVTREEFDRAVGNRKERDLAIIHELAQVYRNETAVFREGENSYAVRLPTIVVPEILARVKA